METEYGKTIATNLRRILVEKEMSSADLARALGVQQSTVSHWLNRLRTPKASMIDRICECLRISKSELVGEQTQEAHYFDPETEKVAQEIMENHDLKALFDAARDISPEELRLIHSMALALKDKEN